MSYPAGAAQQFAQIIARSFENHIPSKREYLESIAESLKKIERHMNPNKEQD